MMARKKTSAPRAPRGVDPSVVEGVERAFKQWLDENTERLIGAITDRAQARPTIIPEEPCGEWPRGRDPGARGGA